MNYSILRILLSILSLSPIRSSKDFDFKWDVASAINETTNNVQEQNVLVLLAYYESNFIRSVASCSLRGDKGRSLGIYQVQPIDKHDYSSACGTLLQQTRLALNYVHRSFEACPGNVGPDLLAMYVSGTCQRGLKEAKHRWSN